ncbi:MAG: trimethylamine methyltransferase family protein [Chloroflexi bacterium]|nr:trimethylamine methyltransferase family protein [Chloroflexota bacterium]
MIKNTLPKYKYMSEEGIEIIHETSLKVLEEYGLEYNHPEAFEALERAGAEVVNRETNHVRLPRGLVLECLAKAPSTFEMQARNHANDVIIGGDWMACAPMYGSPFVHDLETGARRDATLADFQNFAKLAHMTPQIHNTGGTLVEPEDTDLDTRHLDMVYSLIKYSDKTFMGSVTSAANARDTIEMAAILFGGKEAIAKKPAVISVINVNSPRRYDTRMLESMLEYVKAGQPVLVTPFSSAGAMSPAAMGGTLVQVNAEVLAGVTLAQIVNPGWLEAGLVSSYEKFVIDIELLRMMEHFIQGIPLDAEGLALDAMEEVGPGGHFLGAAHTMRHYRTAFYRPIISDLMAFERWTQKGSKSAAQRANALCKKWLADYQEPKLDPGIDEGLREYIAKRKDEIKTNVGA